MLDDEVRRLADIEAIKQLRGRYSRAIDTKDWGLVGESLSSDARLATDAGPKEGRDAIIEWLSGALATATTMHHQHTPEIEMSGADAATGIWAMQDVVHIGDFTLRGWGHYHEEYIRTDEGWRIRSSTLIRVRVDAEGTPPGR